MSHAAGDSPRARRWRALYDVALGVVLFVSLLIPAVRQASTGTHAGLRNAMLLLLLDLGVLVMLSRHVTSPEREHPWGARAQATKAVRLLAPHQVPSLLDERGAPVPDLGLILTGDDIAVRQGADDHAPLARLAWPDCAAVVASEVDVRKGPEMVFLQFVAVREDRIRHVRGLERTRGAARALGVSEAAGAMVWGVPTELVSLIPPILAHIEQHHPEVRVVHPGVEQRRRSSGLEG